MARNRRRPLIAVLLVLAALATAGFASAASLGITGARLGTFTDGHPCPGTLQATTPTTTTGSASTVDVVAPAACAGRLLTVAVQDGYVVRQGTGIAAAGSVTIALDGQYTPSTGVVVDATASGWGLATTWAYTPPAVPAIRCWTSDPLRPCTATVVVRDSWATGYNLDITIADARTTNANNPVPWTIEIDFSNGTYPFVPNALDGSGVVPGANACGTRPVMTFTGVTNWGEHNVLRRDSVRTVWIQARNDGIGTVLDCVP